MLHYIHRIDRTMQNAEAGGNRLHGRYGVQVAQHRQPFPQFKSIPNENTTYSQTGQYSLAIPLTGEVRGGRVDQ